MQLVNDLPSSSYTVMLLRTVKMTFLFVVFPTRQNCSTGSVSSSLIIPMQPPSVVPLLSAVKSNAIGVGSKSLPAVEIQEDINLTAQWDFNSCCSYTWLSHIPLD